MSAVFNGCMAFTCILFSAITSGLNLGLLSVDELQLKIKCLSGEEDEAIAAKKLMPLIHDHHRLLVTLLLCNSLAAEALPLFLDSLVSPFWAVIISVGCMLIFAEILPAAVFTGAGSLTNSAKLASFVEFLLTITSPISVPVGYFLDWLFPHDHDHKDGVAMRQELDALMIIHANHDNSNNAINHDEENPNNGNVIGGNSSSSSSSSSFDVSSAHGGVAKGGLDEHETQIITGVLRLHRFDVSSEMTPIDKVDMLSGETEINELTLHQILKNGHSRLPIYRGEDPTCIAGILLTKYLIKVHLKNKKALYVKDMSLQEPMYVKPDVSLMDMLKIFTTSYSHLAVVTWNPEATKLAALNKVSPPRDAVPVGIITFEDVMERMIGVEIEDEYDRGVAGTGQRFSLSHHNSSNYSNSDNNDSNGGDNSPSGYYRSARRSFSHQQHRQSYNTSDGNRLSSIKSQDNVEENSDDDDDNNKDNDINQYVMKSGKSKTSNYQPPEDDRTPLLPNSNSNNNNYSNNSSSTRSSNGTIHRLTSGPATLQTQRFSINDASVTSATSSTAIDNQLPELLTSVDRRMSNKSRIGYKANAPHETPKSTPRGSLSDVGIEELSLQGKGKAAPRSSSRRNSNNANTDVETGSSTGNSGPVSSISTVSSTSIFGSVKDEDGSRIPRELRAPKIEY